MKRRNERSVWRDNNGKLAAGSIGVWLRCGLVKREVVVRAGAITQQHNNKWKISLDKW
jgi:hypothetical protein